jgi:hypothetical protein
MDPFSLLTIINCENTNWFEPRPCLTLDPSKELVPSLRPDREHVLPVFGPGSPIDYLTCGFKIAACTRDSVQLIEMNFKNYKRLSELSWYKFL